MNTLPTPETASHDPTAVQVSRGVALRADKCVGFFPDARPLTSTKPDQVQWYHATELAKLLNLPLATLVARLKARWSRAELRQPVGYEAVVDARRNGLTYNGETLPLHEWSARTGVRLISLEARLFRGYSVEDVLSPADLRRRERTASNDIVEPKAPHYKGRFMFNGAPGTLEQHAAAQGMSPHTVRSRLRKGASLQVALTPGRKGRSDKGKPRLEMRVLVKKKDQGKLYIADAVDSNEAERRRAEG